jgi:hypothetical protein
MKAIGLLLLAVVSGVAFLAQAQDEDVRGPDGGTMVQVQTIDIPPFPGAPFHATITANVTRALADGSSQTVMNADSVARDSSGRIYRERRRLVPNLGEQTPQPREIQIFDPTIHRKLICNPATRTCTAQSYPGMLIAPIRAITGPLAGSRGYIQSVGLGDKTIDDLNVTGTRETTTYNPGVLGNQSPLTVMKEIWYSPQLDLNLSVRRADPRFGLQDFSVDNLSLSEPDPALFAMPAGYRLASSSAASEVPSALASEP